MTLTVPEGYDPLGTLDGEPVALVEAAKLPWEDRTRVVAYRLDGTGSVRPWVAGGADADDPGNGVEVLDDGSIRVWF